MAIKKTNNPPSKKPTRGKAKEDKPEEKVTKLEKTLPPANETKEPENKPEKDIETATPEEKPVKSDKAHAKAAEADRKAGHKQAELVAPTPEQRWLELGQLRREIVSLEDELVDAEHQVKEIKDDIKKRETKIQMVLNMAAGLPVQQKLEVESKNNDDKRFMDQSNIKTPEELRRHPQKEVEG